MKQLIHTHPVLQRQYGKVDVFYNNTSGLLVPERFYQADQASQMLEIMRGDLLSGIPLEDTIPEMDAMNLYAVPAALHEELAARYPNVSFAHFNTGWLRKRFRREQKDTLLELVLYPTHIIIALWKDGQLLINQGYDYDTPEDVAWWLLNVVTQWGLQAEELPVLVSGLVETQSPMFTEIQKYFLHVDLDQRPSLFQYDFSFDNYPQHFFSPIFSLALCGS